MYKVYYFIQYIGINGNRYKVICIQKMLSWLYSFVQTSTPHKNEYDVHQEPTWSPPNVVTCKYSNSLICSLGCMNNKFPSIVLDKIYWYHWRDLQNKLCEEFHRDPYIRTNVCSVRGKNKCRDIIMQLGNGNTFKTHGSPVLRIGKAFNVSQYYYFVAKYYYDHDENMYCFKLTRDEKLRLVDCLDSYMEC